MALEIYIPKNEIVLTGRNNYASILINTIITGLSIISVSVVLFIWQANKPDTDYGFVVIMSTGLTLITAYNILKNARSKKYNKTRIEITREGISTYYTPDRKDGTTYKAKYISKILVVERSIMYKFVMNGDEKPSFQFYVKNLKAKGCDDIIEEIASILNLVVGGKHPSLAGNVLSLKPRLQDSKSINDKLNETPVEQHSRKDESNSISVTSAQDEFYSDIKNYKSRHYRIILRGNRVIISAINRDHLITGKPKFEIDTQNFTLKIKPLLLIGKYFDLSQIDKFHYSGFIDEGSSNNSPFVEGQVQCTTKSGKLLDVMVCRSSHYKQKEIIYFEIMEDFKYLVTSLNKLVNTTGGKVK